MEFEYGNFKVSFKYGMEYLHVTAKITFIALFFGVVIGLVVAVVRHYKIPVISQILTVFVTLYQGLPVMVALLIYNLLFSFYIADIIRILHLNVQVRDVDNIVVAYFTLSLAAITSISETFRGAFVSVEKTQYEAGHAVGLSKLQTLRRIIIPQMIPVAIPGLINNMVGTIKGTSLVMTIGVMEVMNASLIPCSRTYSFLEGYVAAALIYWTFTLVLETIARVFEKRTKCYRENITN